MDIVVSVDEASGAISVDGEPAEDIRSAMRMVMEKVEMSSGPMEEPMDTEQPVGAPDEEAMMAAYGKGSQM